MEFSIIIPIYNSEKSLSRCLNSVVEQTFSDFEVLMVDDGSIDNSGEICMMYQTDDSRFRYLPKKNGGVSSARNHGLDHAIGDFIVFLDSDDRYFPDYLASFHKMIELYPDSGHYWCSYNQYVENKELSDKIFCYSKQEEYSILDRKNIMDLHLKTLDGCPWNKLFRRETLKNIRMKDGLSLGEDLLFNWEYLDTTISTTIVVNNVPQYGYYVTSNQSLDRKYYPNFQEIIILMMDQMEQKLEKWNVNKEQWAHYYNSSFYLYEKLFRNTFRSENRDCFKEKVKFNNGILRSKQFQDVYNSKTCFIHPLYSFGYKTKNYRVLLICEKIIKSKNKLMLKGRKNEQ